MPNFAPLLKAGSKGVDALVDALRAFKGPQEEAMLLAQQRAALPIEKGGLGLPATNTAAERAAAMFPNQSFHATPNDFVKIDKSLAGKTSGGNVDAFFATPGSKIANDYIPTEMVPKAEFQSVFRKENKYNKALFDKYKEFQSQSDLFLNKPSVSRPEMLQSNLRYGADRELLPAFEQFVGNEKFLANMKNNQNLASKVYEDALSFNPKMNVETPLSGSNIMPLNLNTKNFIDFDAKGAAWTPELDRKIQSYIAETGGKFDGVNINNVIDNELGKKATTQMIFNPDVVRSRFAAFDPWRRTAATAATFGVAAPDLLAEELRKK